MWMDNPLLSKKLGSIQCKCVSLVWESSIVDLIIFLSMLLLHPTLPEKYNKKIGTYFRHMLSRWFEDIRIKAFVVFEFKTKIKQQLKRWDHNVLTATTRLWFTIFWHNSCNMHNSNLKTWLAFLWLCILKLDWLWPIGNPPGRPTTNW